MFLVALESQKKSYQSDKNNIGLFQSLKLLSIKVSDDA